MCSVGQASGRPGAATDGCGGAHGAHREHPRQRVHRGGGAHGRGLYATRGPAEGICAATAEGVPRHRAADAQNRCVVGVGYNVYMQEWMLTGGVRSGAASVAANDLRRIQPGGAGPRGRAAHCAERSPSAAGLVEVQAQRQRCVGLQVRAADGV